MSLTINGATNTLTAAAGLTIAGNTAITGTLSATKNTDGEQAFTVLNNSAGTSAYSIAQVTNGTTALQLFHTGTGFTPSGIYPTDGSVISGTGSGGLTLNAGYAGASLSLLTQGVERAAFSSAGLAVAGKVSANAGAISFEISAAGRNEATAVYLRNTTAAQASPGVYFYNGDGYRHYIQEGVGTAGLNIQSVDGTPINLVANTAVTGTLSATGITSVTDTTDATSTTAASLKTAGGLGVAKKGYFGDNIVMASGKGIDFSATSDGSGTTTSEVLSDYEEGTFTPAVAGDSTAGTGTYTTQVGHYTKIGNRVFFSINLNWTAHTGTGNLKINGLPFTSANVSGLAHAVTATYINNLALSASNILTPYIGQNDSTIWLNQSPIGAGGSVAQVPMDTSAQLGLSGQYTV